MKHDDDIKLPLLKQDTGLPHDAYYFINVNEP